LRHENDRAPNRRHVGSFASLRAPGAHSNTAEIARGSARWSRASEKREAKVRADLCPNKNAPKKGRV